MNRQLKIALSVVFVLAVAFVVARTFWPKPSGVRKPAAHVVSKKIKPVLPAKKAMTIPWMAPGKKQPLAQMAIILDDWGASGAHVDEVVALGRPVTLAVIPHLSRSAQVAAQAHAHGLGVMLHMPMQPKKAKPSEPRTILTNTSSGEIRRLLDEALSSVPHAEGVNNHQGSAATSDLRVMRTMLSHLKKKGLFFVDSKVIATSTASQAARETGIRFASRDIFIDNVASVDAVKEKLREALRVAQSRGRAVVIGHDRSSTLEALRQMVPEIDKSGVKLVLAGEMAEQAAT